METQTEKGHPVSIVVHNEDTGKNPIDIKGESTDLVQSFITKLYEVLRTTQKPEDRLRCGKSEVNVFSYANVSIAEFQKQHCASHEWTFAGATGGAFCFPRR